MREKTVQDLKSMIDSKEDFQLIDVREEYEFEIVNINGELIPMSTVPEHIDRISREKPVVIYCKSGARSANVVLYLETSHNFSNLYNLKGGIIAWSKEIDNSLPTY